MRHPSPARDIWLKASIRQNARPCGAGFISSLAAAATDMDFSSE
jgi:hypothetical protein